jgi:imidazolonepropionase-like amidohydrolase
MHLGSHGVAVKRLSLYALEFCVTTFVDRLPIGVGCCVLIASIVTVHTQSTRESPEAITAIVGATVIDGNGGPPLADATIVIRGEQIVSVGARRSVTVPPGAQLVDGTGRYAVPGLIDTNVHLGPINGETTFARYWDRLEDIILQAAQLHLKHGVTTVRDSYGPLVPLKAIRDAIARGSEVGPRMYVAGNIVGWGGPYTTTFSRIHESGISFFQEQVNELFTHGSGEELLHMTAAELRVAIDKYLDLGPDFIKYGGTEHNEYPTLISFSPRAQKAIVDETHMRGLFAETHSTTLEGLYTSIEAGLDVIQHPEVLGFREITDELLNLILERKIICSMLPNKYTGKLWQDHVKEREKKATGTSEKDRADHKQRLIPRTPAEIRRQTAESGFRQEGTLLVPNLEMRRANARKLIQRGAIISVGADSVVGEALEFRRTEKPPHLEPGIATIIAIEGLVEMGMTPAQAIVAATRNGAMACKGLQRFGTLEPGKIADVLLVGADPLAHISNLRKVEVVVKQGRAVDLKSLPTRRPYGEWSKSSS